MQKVSDFTEKFLIKIHHFNLHYYCYDCDCYDHQKQKQKQKQEKYFPKNNKEPDKPPFFSSFSFFGLDLRRLHWNVIQQYDLFETIPLQYVVCPFL